MKFAFIYTQRDEFPVQRISRVMGVSPSGYYAWLRRPTSQREQDNQALLEKIRQVHAQSRKTYGSPRIHAVLRKQGIACGRNRVARLMRREGIRPAYLRRWVRTTRSDPRLPVAPNRLGRNFSAQHPNQKWVSDLTYIPTRQGWLFLAAVMDLFSRKIVGWALDTSMSSSLTDQALQMALQHRKPELKFLHHSDRGSQYACASYQKLLNAYLSQVSMSRVGNCYDNAPMESFFATLKKELVHQENYLSSSQAKLSIFEYIEVFYNRQRLHSTLGFCSPDEFERSFNPSLSHMSTFSV